MEGDDDEETESDDDDVDRFSLVRNKRIEHKQTTISSPSTTSSQDTIHLAIENPTPNMGDLGLPRNERTSRLISQDGRSGENTLLIHTELLMSR